MKNPGVKTNTLWKGTNRLFQRFFTAEPAGEGTGWGLSLGYDSVKAHNAGFMMKTKEEGARFLIQLPSADKKTRFYESKNHQRPVG
ncbi:ATP-binding protein [Flavisolibacter nicotianae]|uniref:hypothetical protein n=1 Tax=Flavisolibacter nicotianae TaxID=2364882 RepID=UPI00196996B7|nr:hypothetical protein [Flavisolibacter nicotianae]